MDEINSKLKVPIDFDSKSLEDTQLNPYEVVVASAKYARELNDRARKHFGPAVEIQPRNIAIKSVLSGRSTVVHANKLTEETEITPEKEDI